MFEDGFQLFQIHGRGDVEHAAAGETFVRHEDVAVGIEPQEITEGLDSDDGTGNGITFRDRLLQKGLQGFPGAAAQVGMKFPVIEEVTAENFRDAEDKIKKNLNCGYFDSKAGILTSTACSLWSSTRVIVVSRCGVPSIVMPVVPSPTCPRRTAMW